MDNTYLILDHVWNRQPAPLPKVEVDYTGVTLYCYSGSIIVWVNDIGFELEAGESFNENIFNGQTFEITGTGDFKGYLRGR